jgi:hypothetical protein
VEEGNQELGRSPGQARAHTGEVGVGVGVGRASAIGRGIVRPAASALASLHAARTGMGWLGYTALAGPRGSGRWLLGWARLPAGFRPTTNVNIENSFFFFFPNLFIICKLI